MSLIYTTDSGGKRTKLYIGARSDAKNREKLQQWGVSHILNVTPEKAAGIQSGVPNFFEKDRTFVYKRIPVYDVSTSATELLGHADSIVNFISKGLHHGAVLVHCNMGQSRSTTAALFYLIKKANMSLEKGLELIKRRRPTAEPIPSFLEILNTFESQCQKERDQGGDKAGEKRGPDPASGADSEKRRKVGPSIGPPHGRSAIGPSLPPSKKKTASIGPALPPGIAKSKPTVGPSLPPSSQSSTINNGTSPAKKKPIGPSLPPS